MNRLKIGKKPQAIKIELETYMHSLEANTSMAERVSVASQDIVGGLVSPNINLAIPNWSV